MPVKQHCPWLAAAALTLGAATTLPLQAAPSLAEAVDAALRLDHQQPRVEALRAQGDALRIQAASPLAGDPSLAVRHQTDKLHDDMGYVEWEAGLELPLWLPGQRDARRGQADADEQRADATALFLSWQTAGQVREAVWDASIAEGRVKQAELALKSAKALETDVRKRTLAGELSRLDLVLTQKESAIRELELQAARDELEHARETFELLTGFHELPEPAVETPVEGGDDIPAGHPHLMLADATVAHARAERDRVRGERRGNPLLTIGGKHQRDAGASDYYDSLGLEIRVPLGLASQAAPQQSAAELRLTDSEAERARLRRELELTLAGARHAREALRRSLDIAQRQQVLAAEAHRLTQRGFELGESDLAQLLRTREQALQAELDLRLRSLELDRATARLNQALGNIPE